MADAQVSDACDSDIVWVQIPSLAPKAAKCCFFYYLKPYFFSKNILTMCVCVCGTIFLAKEKGEKLWIKIKQEKLQFL